MRSIKRTRAHAWIFYSRGVLGVLTTIVVSGTLGGCGGGAATTSAATAENPPTATAGDTGDTGDDPASTSVVEHHRHHHGGLTMFIAMSLDTLGVTPEQRPGVLKVQQDLYAKLAPAHVAEQSVLSALADGVAAGTVDTTKVDAALAQADGAFAGVEAATADSLNQLHAILDPAERSELAQKVQAHWTVWQHANDEDDGQTVQREHGHYLASVTRDLGLSGDQVGRVKNAMQANAPEKAKRLDANQVETSLAAFETAFASESFDAHALSGADAANVQLASHGMRRMARFYEALAPVLTPDQRVQVAAKLRAHATVQEGAP